MGVTTGKLWPSMPDSVLTLPYPCVTRLTSVGLFLTYTDVNEGRLRPDTRAPDKFMAGGELKHFYL